MPNTLTLLGSIPSSLPPMHHTKRLGLTPQQAMQIWEFRNIAGFYTLIIHPRARDDATLDTRTFAKIGTWHQNGHRRLSELCVRHFPQNRYDVHALVALATPFGPAIETNVKSALRDLALLPSRSSRPAWSGMSMQGYTEIIELSNTFSEDDLVQLIRKEIARTGIDCTFPYAEQIKMWRPAK